IALALRKVLVIARHCLGGIVVGFRQFVTTVGIWKPDGVLPKVSARTDSNPIFGGYPDSGPLVDRASWGKCGDAVDAIVALTAAASVSARYSRGLRMPSAECGAWLL